MQASEPRCRPADVQNSLRISPTKHRSSFIVHCSLFIVYCASCIFHHPSSIIHHPSSIVHCALCIVHRASCIVHRASCIVHRPSSIFHRAPVSLLHPINFCAEEACGVSVHRLGNLTVGYPSGPLPQTLEDGPLSPAEIYPSAGSALVKFSKFCEFHFGSSSSNSLSTFETQGHRTRHRWLWNLESGWTPTSRPLDFCIKLFDCSSRGAGMVKLLLNAI